MALAAMRNALEENFGPVEKNSHIVCIYLSLRDRILEYRSLPVFFETLETSAPFLSLSGNFLIVPSPPAALSIVFDIRLCSGVP